MDNRQFEYQRDLDALRYTVEQKALLAQMVSDRAERQREVPVRRHRPLRRTALLAAAAAALLTVGAGASGGLKTAAEALSAIFGAAPAQTEIIDRIGRPVNASDTRNGITITADAIIGDKYNACIVYTISRDDGEPFEYDGLRDYGNGSLNLLFEKWDVDAGRMGGSYGSSWFFDQTPGDNAVQLARIVSAVGAAFNGDVTVRSTFEDLCIRTPDERTIPIAEGKWAITFQANLEDCALTLGNGETFEQGGMTFTIDEISLSPVGITVQYTVNQVVQWSDAPSGRLPESDRREIERYMENVEILVTKTDGTVLDLSSTGGSISPRDGVTVCSKGRLFQEEAGSGGILPLSDIESVSIGGVVFGVDVD